MSKSSKVQTGANSSTSSSSICPPTAASPSILTAEDLTDPGKIPTALSNSVNTAIGGTPSDFESNSGLSDTSAGSGRANSNISEPKTAKSPTSPELLMNDLRRGSLFGKSKSQATGGGPLSVTNITFSNNTNLSTASQLSTADEKMSENSGKSLKTGISASKKSSNRKNRSKKRQFPPKSQLESLNSPAKSKKSIKSKKASKSQKVQKLGDFSGKSAKSKRNATKNGEFSRKATKLMENAAKTDEISQKAMKKEAPPTLAPKNPNESVYFPQPPQQKSAQRAPKGARKTPVAYNFPGVGKNTRPVVPQAPPTSATSSAPSSAPLSGNGDHCVYDVAQLGPAQRRFPGPAKAPPTLGARKPPPKSLFGSKKMAIPPVAAAPKSESDKETTKPTGNKIVVIGTTADGKTTIQMTIDMQVVAGEALKGSDGPVELIPKKIMVAGKEYPVDSKIEK